MRHLETEETEVDSVVSGVSGDTEQPMMIRCEITMFTLLWTRTTTSLSRCLLLVLTLYCPGWVYLNI